MKAVSGQATSKTANGTVEVDLTPPNGYEWSVGHIAVSTNAGTVVTNAQVFLNQRFICGSSQGNGDSADGTPVPVRSGDSIRTIWTNVPQNVVCVVQMLVAEGLIGTGVLV